MLSPKSALTLTFQSLSVCEDALAAYHITRTVDGKRSDYSVGCWTAATGYWIAATGYSYSIDCTLSLLSNSVLAGLSLYIQCIILRFLKRFACGAEAVVRLFQACTLRFYKLLEDLIVINTYRFYIYRLYVLSFHFDLSVAIFGMKKIVSVKAFQHLTELVSISIYHLWNILIYIENRQVLMTFIPVTISWWSEIFGWKNLSL